MIPYFFIPMIQLGPFMIHTWGLLVGLGFIAGLLVARKRAQLSQLDEGHIVSLAIWLLAMALVGARLAYVFFYDWGFFRDNPLDIFKVWEGGMASFGGILAASITSLFYAKRKNLNPFKYADAFMYALPISFGIGRIGCFLNHLHPGRLSTFPLAVAFPEGARLDMGLMESLAWFMLFGVVVWLSRRPRPDGFYLAVVMGSYGVIRFLLDFWRASDLLMSDARYVGLTLAQYGSLLLILGGAYLWRRVKQRSDLVTA